MPFTNLILLLDSREFYRVIILLELMAHEFCYY